MCTLVILALAAGGSGSEQCRTAYADEVSMLQLQAPDPLFTTIPAGYNSSGDAKRACGGVQDCTKPELCGLGFTVYPYVQPELWGTSYEGWETCAGQSQSPINLQDAKKRSGTFEQHYKPAKNLRLWNDGHSLKVRGLFGSLQVGCCQIPSVQFHFHTPSEHLINNKSFAMEMHIVHQGGSAGSAAVGILFNVGKPNECLKNVFEAPAPRAGCDKFIGDIDVSCFFDAHWDGQFFQYRGSLSTPPCTEGLEWYVRKTPVTLSQDQLDVFKTRYLVNNRPVQPLNHRPLYLISPKKTQETGPNVIIQ